MLLFLISYLILPYQPPKGKVCLFKDNCGKIRTTSHVRMWTHAATKISTLAKLRLRPKRCLFRHHLHKRKKTRPQFHCSGPRSHLTAWGTVVEKYLRGIPGIEQYVIMPNHLHMIVFIRQTLGGPQGSAAPTSDLSMRIKAFKSLVTKALGFLIFQRSYYDHVIRCEEDYLRIAEYIQNNPAKWMEDTYYVARS